MTFSDAKVAELVNANFVPAWHNRAPGFRNDDYAAEKSIFEHSHEAYTTKNICTFFLTPEGKVFHYAAGYYAPALYLEVLETAVRMRTAAFDARVQLHRDGLDTLRRLHAERAKRSADEAGRRGTVPGGAASYRDTSHTHGEGCAWVVTAMHAYFARLHMHWSAVKALPSLADVRFAYLYGDDFTEEAEGASGIAIDKTLPRRRG